MDLPSKNMYDTYKDKIWKELGPLDPDWFDTLTARTFNSEGNVSDPDELCANQEGHFKTPFDKTAIESQLYSTPKVFRGSQFLSLESEDEDSFTGEQEKETLPWTPTQSPCLFRMPKERVPGSNYGGIQNEDSFDLLKTPQKSPGNYAKRISESLGAQIHPDISWTSSLNTPPAVASTLILTKTAETPCPVSVSEDSGVFVCKLFPHLSNATSVAVMSPKNNDKGVVCPKAVQSPESEDVPHSPLNHSEHVWKQKLPGAIEDGEIRSAMASVLDGAENVLSVFFSNSSSALRKVKTDRIKRKQIVPTKERGSTSTEILMVNNTALGEQKTAHQEPDGLPSMDTQWSPLSLSEFPPSDVDTALQDIIPATQVENNNLTKRLLSDSISAQPVRPPMERTDSGSNQKKRKFIYTVESSKLQVEKKETPSQKTDTSPWTPAFEQEVCEKQLVKAQKEASRCIVGKNVMPKEENLSEENLPPSVLAKVQDIDMSQLCRDFAQDFSQMSDAGKVAQDTAWNGFSPLACLSAMKQAKHKTRPTSPSNDCKDQVRTRSNVSTLNQNTSIIKQSLNDSRFQSAIANVTQMTGSSFVLLSSENNGPSQEGTGFKTGIQMTTPFLSAKKENEKEHKAKTDATLPSRIKESQTLGPVKELHWVKTPKQLTHCAKGTVDNMTCLPTNTQACDILRENASGFKTASNKRIEISSTNLQRAKILFEETEGKDTFSFSKSTNFANETKDGILIIHDSVKSQTSNANQPPSSSENISSQLTASQKADVTELCTLLEKAESQFEFTQFKTSKLKQYCRDNTFSPQKVDADFLTGIDFDDGLSSDAEQQLAVNVMCDEMTDGNTNLEAGSEHVFSEDKSSPLKHISECSNSIQSAKAKLVGATGHTDSGKLENKNHLRRGVGFKTAGGNILSVSKRCLSKAKALFADLDETPVSHQKSLEKQSALTDAKKRKLSVESSGGFLHHKDTGGRIQDCLPSVNKPVCSERQDTGTTDEDAANVFKNSKMGITTCQNGFQMASGKEISVSSKNMRDSDAFFKDCEVLDISISRYKKTKEPSNGNISRKKNLKFKNGMKVNFSEEPISEFGNANVGSAVHHLELQRDVEINNAVLENSPALKNAVSFHGNSCSTAKTLSSLSCTITNNTDSPEINELSSGAGFCTASGKKVVVSADAMKKAERLLTEINTLEDTNQQLNQKGDALKTCHLTNQIQAPPHKNNGFQTASGKGVAISSAALKKSKLLLSESDGVDEEMYLKPTLYEMFVPGQPPRNNTFLAASGKPLGISSEALQKAKALFSDISFSAENPDVSDSRKSDNEQYKAENTAQIHFGFSTAAGAKVHVSQKNLLKAKHSFKELDDSVSEKNMQEADAFLKDNNKDASNRVSVKQEKNLALISGSSGEEKNLLKCKQFKKVRTTSEDPKSGLTESDNVNVGPVINNQKTLHCDDVEIHSQLSKYQPDSIDADSLHGNPSLTPKPLSPLMCAKSESSVSPAISGSSSVGFCTASRQRVSVSDAITKAKNLLNDSATSEDTIKQLKPKRDALPRHNGGFQTASGKGVAVSSAALQKAKSMLRECDEVEDKISGKPTHSKMPAPGQPPRSYGFLAASGKPVSISTEALSEAKALFSDISSRAENPDVSDRRNMKEDIAKNTEKISYGFSTASGAKVHVSQKNLMKAKTLLNECDYSYSTSQHVQDVKVSSLLNLSTTSAKESTLKAVTTLNYLQETDHERATPKTSISLGDCGSIKDEALTDLNFKEDKINPFGLGDLHDSHGEEILSDLDCEMELTSGIDEPEVKMTEESSVLKYNSLNLSGCTGTQQQFLAQEALDCTKALLEDESLAGRSLQITLENVPLPENNPKSNIGFAVEQRCTGKRRVEDNNMTGQPPLKRRLLEEFDRAVYGRRGSTLHPEISCPTGAMKDRCIFKYSASLQPNITKPPWKGKKYLQTRLHQTAAKPSDDSRSAHSKTPSFVPPFLRSAKTTQSGSNAVLKDCTKTPTFSPPFKKQRTVQEELSKPWEQEDKPLFKETQNTYDVTSNTSKADVQMVVLADATADQNLPVCCGSKDSEVEKSHMEDTPSASQDMLENLHNIELARDMQDMRIRKKKRQTIRPLPGSLFLTKTSGVARIPLKAAVNEKAPAIYTPKQLYSYGVHQHVCDIASESAESFRFGLQQFIKQEAYIDGGGIQLADGGWLIPSNDGTAGKEEFYRALCDTPGVDPKLISEEWVNNHYRWIVWKQASMERSFPETMGSFCLNPEQVLLQLKYRYDVEVDHSRRPALKKIMEKDDTAAKTLVLCLSGVVSGGLPPKRKSFSDVKNPQGPDTLAETPSAVVWLTDGWYAIKAQLDEPLTAMLHKGRLAVGGKLIIHGAQLVGSQDACCPLEAPESLMLKICANCSRPTRWDTKLGFHKDPRPFLLPVSSLYSNGGSVGCVDIIVLRSYPIQWMERKPDGVVFRSVRAEEKEARRYNSQKQKAMDIIYAKIKAEFEKEDKGNKRPQCRRRTVSRQDIANLQDGEELYEAIGDDSAYLEAHLSKEQMETLHAYRCSLMEKKQAELQDRYQSALESAEDPDGSCPKREVTPVWRLRLADSMGQLDSVFQLNLWRPSSELQSSVKEGCRYKVYNLTASEGKKLGRSATLQLTGTKKTLFQGVQTSQEWLSTHFRPRFSTHFMDLQNPEFQPLCGEIDLTGAIISVTDGQGSSPAFYLADENLNFVKVCCFSSLAQSGLEDLVKTRALLALSNLQLRGQAASHNAVVYAGDLTMFSTNPKEAHLRESLSRLRNMVQGQQDFFLTAEEKLSHLTGCDGLTSESSPVLQTQTSASADRRRSTMTSVTPQQPCRGPGSFTPVNRNPPPTNCSTEKNPVHLKRRRALDYLARVSSPPPLSQLSSAASLCVKKTFNPPRRFMTPSTLKTEPAPTQKPVNSPVEDQWVNDEELAMIDTQALHSGNVR